MGCETDPMEITEADAQLLNAVQWSFPLDAAPYAVLAERLGLTEDEVIDRLRAVKAEGVLRQLSAIFDTRALGYTSALIAAKVDADHIDAAAEIINEHPGVSHNYKRNHDYNLWYTLAVPPGEDFDAHLSSRMDDGSKLDWRLAQDGTPADLLTLPIDDAAAAVVGDHRGLKRLALLHLADVQPSRGPVVTPLATAGQARAAAASGDSAWVLVVDVDDRLLGWADTARLGPTGYVTDTPLLEVERTVSRVDSLLTVLDQMVLSPARMAVRLEPDGRLGGVITRAVIEPHLPQAGTGW